MTQRSVVLALLREAGPRGVDNHDLIYQFGITRAAAIIHDLRHEEGMDIETQDLGDTPDGRKKVCRYILRSGARLPVQKPVEEPQILPEAAPLTFGCGCVRSADGRAWERRCDDHFGGHEVTVVW